MPYVALALLMMLCVVAWGGWYALAQTSSPARRREAPAPARPSPAPAWSARDGGAAGPQPVDTAEFVRVFLLLVAFALIYLVPLCLFMSMVGSL